MDERRGAEVFKELAREVVRLLAQLVIANTFCFNFLSYFCTKNEAVKEVRRNLGEFLAEWKAFQEEGSDGEVDSSQNSQFGIGSSVSCQYLYSRLRMYVGYIQV